MPEASFFARRTNPRFPLMAEAEITKIGDGSSFVAQLSELSSRGCYLDTIKPFPIGSKLRLRIYYGSDTCELPGKVIYTHSGYGTGLHGMGVLFGDMAAEQHSAINTWLDELAKRAHPQSEDSGGV